MPKTIGWPTDMYCLFLQSVLTGKAKDVCCALSTVQCSDYWLFKERILQTYELVPEVCHQKFRNLVKQTAKDMWSLQEKRKVCWTGGCHHLRLMIMTKLNQLVGVEEFKRGVSAEIRVHFYEHKVTDLKSAAVLADDYALTHK